VENPVVKTKIHRESISGLPVRSVDIVSARGDDYTRFAAG